MARMYMPIRSETVPASPPHEGSPAYFVSFGLENWGSGSQYVYKVQMMYDGVVAGRKSPSYPADSDDLDRVYEAMRRIKAGGGRRERGKILPVGEEPGMSIAEANAVLS